VFSFSALRKSLRRKAARAAATHRSALPVEPAVKGSCLLASCATGSRATVLSMRCGDAEACRLRALGLCEGANVSVVEARNCMLLDVRGARLAVGSAITAGITVLPLQS
jgi:Fe2+ transport system protein FeoA